MTAFKVLSASAVEGYVQVEFDLPDATKAVVVFDLYAIVGGNDAAELEIANGISQQVDAYILAAFPPPRPQPTAVTGMVGKSYGG